MLLRLNRFALGFILELLKVDFYLVQNVARLTAILLKRILFYLVPPRSSLDKKKKSRARHFTPNRNPPLLVLEMNRLRDPNLINRICITLGV